MLKKRALLPSQTELADLNAAFEGAKPQAVLQWVRAHATEGEVPLVSSFGADSVVLIHMIASIDPAYPVVFIDTGKHFYDTLRYRDELAAHFGLSNLQNVAPDSALVAKDDPHGALWIADADACCALRKKAPLEAAMASFGGWISGRKRFQTSDRDAMQVFETKDGKLKINPLAYWDAKDVAGYIRAHSLPGHPLVPRGYLSIGCAPCTSPVEEGGDVRSGRWKGSEKTECGLHI